MTLAKNDVAKADTKPARRTTAAKAATTPAPEATALAPVVVAPAVALAPAMPAARTHEVGDAKSMDSLAKELKAFIVANNLSSKVRGNEDKEYVNVEGWQFAGSRMGVVPIVEHVINVSDYAAGELKYQAKVTLLNLATNATVGAGFAICSNKESGKKFYQEFAIASMSQTRAIGKAFRNMCAWMIRAAGYEPTPLEEMEYTGNGNATTAAAPAPVMAVAPVEEERPKVYPIRSEAPEDSQQAAPVQLATASQKEELIRLLSHPLITAQEKKKMMDSLNRLDSERATAAIAKLRKAIEDREGTSAVAS